MKYCSSFSSIAIISEEILPWDEQLGKRPLREWLIFLLRYFEVSCSLNHYSQNEIFGKQNLNLSFHWNHLCLCLLVDLPTFWICYSVHNIGSSKVKDNDGCMIQHNLWISSSCDPFNNPVKLRWWLSSFYRWRNGDSWVSKLAQDHSTNKFKSQSSSLFF